MIEKKIVVLNGRTLLTMGMEGTQLPPHSSRRSLWRKWTRKLLG